MCVLLLASCLAVVQCRSLSVDGGFAAATCQPPLYEGAAAQTCSREYAGELLAYFMQVVLGKAGRIEQREAWRLRALGQPLDLEAITEILNGGGRDKSKLMVLDANMMGFSEVLYHYDPMLNQFKGRFVYHSVYPSPALIALRILLLKKIHLGEKIDLTAVLARQDLLLSPEKNPASRTLEKMNLKADEFRLLRQVFQAEPQFIAYLHNPFLVKTLAEIGAIRHDRYVAQLNRQANYRGIYPRGWNGTDGNPAVTIAILPSMTKEFASDGSTGKDGSDRFFPTETYHDTTAGIMRGILDKVNSRFQETAPEHAEPDRWKEQVEAKIQFFNADKRPLLVYPQNVKQVLADICPEADYAIILLGENVYRAVEIDPQRDTYPTVNRSYLDIADVRHGQAEAELDQISEVVFAKLKKRLAQNPQDFAIPLTDSPDRPSGPSGDSG